MLLPSGPQFLFIWTNELLVCFRTKFLSDDWMVERDFIETEDQQDNSKTWSVSLIGQNLAHAHCVAPSVETPRK